ncbi:MAG: RNA polymerase sigma factor [Sphingomonadales bacterium]
MTDAFADELVRLIPRLRRFARSLTGDADRADDLVQDAIERALARRTQWQPGSRLDHWLLRIMRNRWIDDWRMAKARGVHVGTAEAEALPGLDGRVQLENEMRKTEITRAMAALSAEYRETVALVLIEGFNYREAADILGVSEGTIASRLARAKGQLLRQLSDQTERVAT